MDKLGHVEFEGLNNTKFCFIENSHTCPAIFFHIKFCLFTRCNPESETKA